MHKNKATPADGTGRGHYGGPKELLYNQCTEENRKNQGSILTALRRIRPSIGQSVAYALNYRKAIGVVGGHPYPVQAIQAETLNIIGVLGHLWTPQAIEELLSGTEYYAAYKKRTVTEFQAVEIFDAIRGAIL